ncbi:MAG: hypothetical protein GY812_05870 [Actinomycetia bacterium]|nr:hypothetical protein [Actinomycetes bacterium]
MASDQRLDRVLGGSGLVLVVAGLVAVSNLQGDSVNTVVGLSMVAWVGLITWRHSAVHRGGPGRGLLVASWIVLGVLLLWTLVQAAGTTAFDDGVLRGIGSLASSPPAVIVVVPLVLASLALLLDRRSTT